MKKFIVYHADCMDGMGAAWAAWKKLGDDAIYVPWTHTDPVPDFGTEQAIIYCLDIAFTPEQYKVLRDSPPHHGIMIIDHHFSTMNAYQELIDEAKKKDEANDNPPLASSMFRFDMNHSGAVLAWLFFHDMPPPKFLEYIEDRDLWKNELPNTAEFTAAIMNKPKTIKYYDYLSTLDIHSIIKMGECILEENRYMLYNILKGHALWATIEGVEMPIVNSNVLMSDVGNALLERYPDARAAAYFYMQNDGLVKVGLRSNDRVDVSAIAVAFKGGGHRAASAFVVTTSEFNRNVKLVHKPK